MEKKKMVAITIIVILIASVGSVWFLTRDGTSNGGEKEEISKDEVLKVLNAEVREPSRGTPPEGYEVLYIEVKVMNPTDHKIELSPSREFTIITEGGTFYRLTNPPHQIPDGLTPGGNITFEIFQNVLVEETASKLEYQPVSLDKTFTYNIPEYN